MPIHELVRLSTAAPQASSRITHLRRALEEYLMEFNSCRCAPCKYNGIPVFIQSKCSCVCKQGYRGDACEETLRKSEGLNDFDLEISTLTVVNTSNNLSSNV